jgi:NAD(P)-dependent dehydrogenase (short-subunit alcohol dehydrogenase family)
MKHKNILITGGLGHLGFDIATQLLKNSNNYLILIDKKKMSSKISSFYKKNKSRMLFIKMDISKINDYKKLNSTLRKKIKYLDVIINNAGYYENDKGFDANFLNEKFKSWEEVFKVNLYSPFFLVQNLYRLLLKANNPSIINIGSIYGSIAPDFNLYKGTRITNPASYNCSKAALLQLTKWMSSNLAPKIRSNIISPGGIYRRQNKSFLRKYNLKNPMKRMAKEKDISFLVEFMISSKANYLNGQNIFVDGGFANL